MRGIELATANMILQECITHGRREQLSALAIVVLDSGARLKAAAVEDGCGTLRHEIALGKASAALGLGFGTRQFHQAVKDGAIPEMFAAAINGAADGRFIPLPGGVLILHREEIIGAVGVSGASSDQDEAVAVAAIEAAGLTASA